MRSGILEAQAANGGRDLDYDELVELPYMDAVCRETPRLIRRRRSSFASTFVHAYLISAVRLICTQSNARHHLAAFGTHNRQLRVVRHVNSCPEGHGHHHHHLLVQPQQGALGRGC